MRQLATCGYCARPLCDAFEVDHLNENRTDDREENLVATCALCHAVKSRHVRLARDWSDMRANLTVHLQQIQDRWRSGVEWDVLPLWLQKRVGRTEFRAYALHVDPCHQACISDWNQYRYAGAQKPTYRNE